MEAIAQRVQDYLAAQGQQIAVYLGSEWLEKQPELPHVIVVPGDGEYAAPDGSARDALAGVQIGVGFVCKGALFEEATLLAEACYAAVRPSANLRATLRLRSELWGNYVIRVATLSATFPGVLTRGDVARVRVTQFTQLAQYLPRPSEVPDDPETRAEGTTQFLDDPNP
ncbi:hypothetical protein [Deinococcus petrolearius]|uniref:Uncharacterized protein n=1 Tax=Deinococcus petrolearius TaxID=1751295 RepID=A0ABW1DHA2_9DEIO